MTAGTTRLVHRGLGRATGFIGVGGALVTVLAVGSHAAPPGTTFTWETVVNNGDFMPTDVCDPTAPDATAPPCRRFNSYNQPSVNDDELVVFRARSRGGQQGGGQPVHGVYTRDMDDDGPVVRIIDRDTLIPEPNNNGAELIEPPSFPRIDISSDTMATRGNHTPVWTVFNDAGEIVEQVGTTGIYTNPFGPLITGASKLGGVPDFSFFEVPEAPGTPFDVFPGAPAVTRETTIVFKGNSTVDLIAKTGVYFRDLDDEPIPLPDGTLLAPAGGTSPVVLIANTDTVIPGTSTLFGSTAPPSAAGDEAVFAGFDNEETPTLGGIFLAPLTGTLPPLTTLVAIGERVPGEPPTATFNKIGEGLSFDGRFVGFWGAWGTETKTLVLQCPTEGNQQRIAFCNAQFPDGFPVEVPVNQGIFVHDLQTGQTRAAAKAPDDFDDFVYWNFSGRVPGTDEGDDGEPARWRSAAFVALSGTVDDCRSDAGFHVAFKARTGEVVDGAYADPIDGIYLRRGPGGSPFLTVIETGMDGTSFDPEAINPDTGEALPVTEMGIERDGFRGDALVINASFGTEEAGWAGIYLTDVPRRVGLRPLRGGRDFAKDRCDDKDNDDDEDSDSREEAKRMKTLRYGTDLLHEIR